MMKVILFIGLITLLCGDVAKALQCYRYEDDDRDGNQMCIAYKDCTNISQIITCSGDEDSCGWEVEVRTTPQGEYDCSDSGCYYPDVS